MINPRVFAGWCLVFAILPGFAEVRIKGRITITNAHTKKTQPLRKARIRIILTEFFDRDTTDVETTTNLNGEFNISKGNPWFRNGYDARIVVVAESPGHLEVQEFYTQVDGYQARSTSFYARQNRTTTKDMHINQSKDAPETVMEYEVGGLLSLDTASDTHRRTGRRAFEIFNEMTDHRLQLMDKALSASDFEEKEVSYPAGDSASYRRPFDYILINDDFFNRLPLDRTSAFRHELSHGIMADTFWLYPGWWEESVSEVGNFFLWSVHWGSNEIFEGTILELRPSSHNLETNHPNEDFAWIEGWAEFLGEVTLFERYGINSVDLESTNPPFADHWLNKVEAAGNRSRVEGEIAAALWDIYDPVAMEPSRFTSDQTPDADMFFDGISDNSLNRIWSIFHGSHPLSFTHGTHLGDRDSFAHYWRFERNFGLRHEFKAILGNRGLIDDHSFPEAGLALEFIDETWTGATVRIRGRVVQPDPESQDKNRVNLYLESTLVQQQTLPGPSVDSSREFSFSQGVFHRAEDPLPRITLAAHDDLNVRTHVRTLQPPANATVSGLSIRCLAVRINNQAMVDTALPEADIPDFDDNRPRDVQENDAQMAPPSQDLEAVTVTFRTEAPPGLREQRFPSGQGWAVSAQDNFERIIGRQVFRGEGLADRTPLRITVRGRNGGNTFQLSRNFNFSEANQFGAGPHQVTFPLHQGIGSSSITVHFIVDLRTVAQDARIIPSETENLTANDWMARTPLPDPDDRPWDHLERFPRENPRPRPPSQPKASSQQKPKPSATLVNPSRTIVQAHRLAEAHARLQGDLGELAHVIRWRLSPDWQTKMKNGARIRDKQALAMAPKLNQPKTGIKLPSSLQNKTDPGKVTTLLDEDTMTFLKQTSLKPKTLASVPLKHQAFLKDWQKRHRELTRQWESLRREHKALGEKWRPARARIMKGLKPNPDAQKGYLEMLGKAQKDWRAIDQQTTTQALLALGRTLKTIRLGK